MSMNGWPCCAHGPLEYKPAGVSQRTGNTYNGFWRCQERRGQRCWLSDETRNAPGPEQQPAQAAVSAPIPAPVSPPAQAGTQLYIADDGSVGADYGQSQASWRELTGLAWIDDPENQRIMMLCGCTHAVTLMCRSCQPGRRRFTGPPAKGADVIRACDVDSGSHVPGCFHVGVA